MGIKTMVFTLCLESGAYTVRVVAFPGDAATREQQEEQPSLDVIAVRRQGDGEPVTFEQIASAQSEVLRETVSEERILKAIEDRIWDRLANDCFEEVA